MQEENKNASKDSIQAFFQPSSVAIIGASEKKASVGKTLTLNLINSSFKGKIFLINPKRETVFGKKAYPSLSHISESIELAIIATPAQTVPELIEECGQKKVKAVVIISAGFKELGKSGQELEDKTIKIAKAHNIRIIGPNCLGLMNPLADLNATFASNIAQKGNMAFLSQSGAMCTAVLDWSKKEAIGFSAFISLGSMADVSWADLIDYLGDDPHTQSILLYMESIGDPKAFIKAASKVAFKKPIIVIKAGRTKEAAQAAASHTGSMAGSDAIFDVAMKRAGVMRVDKIADLFNLASALSKQSLPMGPNLSIITNAGGPSVLATDAAILSGAKLPSPSKECVEALNTFLPDAWSHSNPIDILGDAGAERYAQALEIALKDTSNDGVLVVLSPQDMTDAEGTAQALITMKAHTTKPILASWMGGPSVEKGIKLLSQAGIPNFPFPDNASETFGKMWAYKNDLKKLEEESSFEKLKDFEKNLKLGSPILAQAFKEKRMILSELESKQFLEAWDIPVVKTEVATSPNNASSLAEKMGYPVVLKLFSHTITHKTDVGGVKLNIKNKEEVEKTFLEIEQNVLKKHSKSDFLGVSVQPMIKLSDGYEIILGSTSDPQFGPVILFGLGGTLVEVFKDSALALPPLNKMLADELMQETKIYKALKGIRGQKGADMDKLKMILIRFSHMLIAHPRIKECDINPLFVSADKIIALDARIVLYDPQIKDTEITIPAISST